MMELSKRGERDKELRVKNPRKESEKRSEEERVTERR